tara:strand:- start:32 stop:196 length:165 start_codon:yes stop_codon:yes gene_type:complete
MSGYAKHTLLERLPDDESIAFIQKPFTPQRLVDAIWALTKGLRAQSTSATNGQV